MRELKLDQYGLRWKRSPDVLAHVLPDGRVAVLSQDLERTARVGLSRIHVSRLLRGTLEGLREQSRDDGCEAADRIAPAGNSSRLTDVPAGRQSTGGTWRRGEPSRALVSRLESASTADAPRGSCTQGTSPSASATGKAYASGPRAVLPDVITPHLHRDPVGAEHLPAHVAAGANAARAALARDGIAGAAPCGRKQQCS